MVNALNIPTRPRSWAVTFMPGTWLWVVLIGIAGAGVAEAQEDPNAERAAEPQSIASSGQGVYLDDSFEAADSLARLESLVREARWREAAALLQEVSDEFGDKLIRRGPGYYVGLRRYVAKLIASWPRAGLEAYRAMFERDAAAAFERVSSDPQRDPTEALAVVERFFCTVAALDWADRIAQRAIESGDFTLAEHIYVRLLDEHPDGPAHADRLRSMLAIVRALKSTIRGDRLPPPDDADRPSEQPADPDFRVRWKGQDVPLGQVLAEISDQFTGVRDEQAEAGWPIFGGNRQRSRKGRCSIDELGVQWRFTFAEGRAESSKPAAFDEEDAIEEYVDALTVHPVVWGDVVVLQRYREIVALRRSTGEIAWRFSAGASGTRPGDYIQEQAAGWDSVTVSHGRVYATLPGERGVYYGYQGSQTPDELICLDVRSGEVQWRALPGQTQSRASDVQFDSSPLVDGGRVYVVGRRRRSFGFEDSYLYRLDAQSGAVLSRTHLGSAATGTFSLQLATKTMAALHGDTVYVCSNLGSVAAVSAYTGQVRWLRMYGRIGRGEGNPQGSNVNPWHYNATMWTPEGVVVLPMDSDTVLILAPKDGRTLGSLSMADLGGRAAVMGLHDGVLCAAGEGVACFDVASGQRLWLSTRAEGSAPLGRGVWADDRLLVPMQSGIRVFQVSDGSHSDMPWEPDGSAGNLVALRDQLLVAGARTLTAYVRKSEIWEALRGRMATAPDDPVPALELAEVALRSGETAEALAALDEAVKRAQAAPAEAESDARRRIFADALSFSRTLADRGQLTEDGLDRLFQVAAQFPTEAHEHLTYRLRFAALFRGLERPQQSLRLYQQVLGDRSLRDLAVEPGENHGVTASAYCMERVEKLIKDFGLDIYEPYESEANRLLEAAEQSQDERMLARVVEAFPNSTAAPRALVRRGTMLAQQGRSGEALRFLIQAYHRYSARVDKPDLLKRIADTLEWSGRREDAYRWLTKAAREYPTALIEDGGRRVTFAQYRNHLSDVQDQVEPRRPRIAPPLERDIELTFEAPMSLLEPRFSDEPGMRWSRAFVYAQSGIQAYSPRDGSALWAEPLTVRESVDLLVARDDVVVFASSFVVIGADPASGKRVWSHGRYPKALDRPDADWEDANAIRSFSLRGDMLVLLYEDGRITTLDIRDGSQYWSDTLSPAPVGLVTLGDRLLAYPGRKGDRNVIGLADSLTGDWIDLIETDERRSVDFLAQTLDGQLLAVTTQSMTAYDVDRRAQRWQVSIAGHLRPGSFLLDLDAVYFSPDGRDVLKISLEDGRVLWEAIGLIGRDEADLTLARADAQLLVSTEESIVGVDTVTGMTLWRGTAPSKRKFEHRLLTQDFLVAVNQGGDKGGEAQVFFYDLRNASGVIPKHGAPRVINLEDLRRIVALDGAIFLQKGPDVVYGLTQKE